MGLEAIIVSAKLVPPGLGELTCGAFVDAIARTWLPQFFTARELRGDTDGARVDQDLLADDGRLWRGETMVAGFPLTRLTSDDTLLRQIAASHDVDVLLRGGLRHAPPIAGADEGWYGRIVLPNERLDYLATVRVRFTARGAGVWITLPFGGYPLTSHLPSLDEHFHVQGPAAIALVERNRTGLQALLARLPAALHLEPNGVSWVVEGQYAHLPQDREALRVWEVGLHAAAAQDDARP